MSDGRPSALDRARHPAARARGDHLVALARRVDRAGSIVGPHRAVAVAARAVRGRQRRSVASFAAAYGTTEELVGALEGGLIAPEDVPAPLVALTGIAHLAAAVAGRAIWPSR